MYLFQNSINPFNKRSGANQGSGQGGGRGRQPEGFGLGPSGFCVCPKCGEKVSHQRGIPCYQIKCPKCGTQMTREK